MVSVNTNYGAMVALQNLNKTNNELQMTQTRVNTGLKVSSARDDGGLFAIAQRMRADLKSYEAVTNSLDRAISVVDVALSAGTAISDILTEMRAKALASTDSSLDAASRTAMNQDFIALRDQIASIVANASFNGFNLLNNTTAGIDPLANVAGGSMTVADEDLRLGQAIITVTATQTIDTSANAATALTNVGNSLNNLNAALARLGTASKALNIHNDFVSKQVDETERGIGNLVDADLARESARLQALQVKQQLGTQALGIANQAPGIILSFFGG